MDIRIVDWVGSGESDEILAPCLTKELSHISSVFPLMMVNMQSSISIKAIFLIRFNGSYWSSDTQNVITGPSCNLSGEPGVAALQRWFIVFLTLQTPLSLHEGGWMKVIISPSGFSTLHGRRNCKEISSHGAGSPCKRCGRHAGSLLSPSCQRLAVSASRPVSLLQFHPVPSPG